MRYLLVDFGATYIKCVVYNKGTGEVSNPNHFTSPFKSESTITSDRLYKILDDVVLQYKKVDGVVICTILGGAWENSVYYSWKLGVNPGKHCLIGGLFNAKSHIDHKLFTTAEQYYSNLAVIGRIRETPIYCGLGDTDCVIRSLVLSKQDVAINIGTGSQVITTKSIQRYFPAGRSLLVYQGFFESLGLDMFELIDRVTINDVINSPLEVGLNTFKQSRNYIDGGFISKISEDHFSINNMLGALLRSLVTQYSEAVGDATRILLVGGVSKKIKILHSLFTHYYPQAVVILAEDGVESTHKGMIRYINEQL